MDRFFPRLSLPVSRLAAASALLLASCTVGPNYLAPEQHVPDSFHEASFHSSVDAPQSPAASPAPALGAWWRSFEDHELDALVDRAKAQSLSLGAAEARIRQARAERTIATAALLPEVDANAGYERDRGSSNVAIPLGQPQPGQAGQTGQTGATGASPIGRAKRTEKPAGPTSPLGEGGLPGVTTELYQLGFDSTWELDVFGGLRRSREAAAYSVEAARYARSAAVVSLVAEVTRTYVELRTAQERRALAMADLEAQQGILKIAEARFANGVSPEIDVTRQRAQIAATKATVPALEAAERQSMHQLAYLLNEPLDRLDAELSAPAPLPAEIAPPSTLPSDLIRTRPDVRQAERQLAAATARVGAATADLFPSFSLIGAAGLDSSHIGRLFEWDSRYFSIVPGVRWPILDWGRVRGNIALQDAAEEEAFITYQDTVNRALKEVEDALVSYHTEETRRNVLADQVAAERQALAFARARYEHGVADLLETLDAERQLTMAEDGLAVSRSTTVIDLIALYKAVGGGAADEEAARPVGAD